MILEEYTEFTTWKSKYCFSSQYIPREDERNKSQIIINSDSYEKAVANLLRQGNGNVSIYVIQGWGLKSNVNNSLHRAVQNNASTVALSIDITVINIGLVWDKYRNMSELYSDDTHQSNAGAYLSAICI